MHCVYSIGNVERRLIPILIKYLYANADFAVIVLQVSVEIVIKSSKSILPWALVQKEC